MGKNWMPITVGVLEIIHGIGSLVESYGVYLVSSFNGWEPFVWSELSAFIIFVCGVLAIVGGVYALKRKKWLLVFIGAVVSIYPSIPYVYYYWPEFDVDKFFRSPTLLGFSWVPAIFIIILTVLSRKQFERK